MAERQRPRLDDTPSVGSSQVRSKRLVISLNDGMLPSSPARRMRLPGPPYSFGEPVLEPEAEVEVDPLPKYRSDP